MTKLLPKKQRGAGKMGIYAVGMLLCATACISWRIIQDGPSWPLGAFCLPFFLVPGLSEHQYIQMFADVLGAPVEPNSPILGGTIAFLVGFWIYAKADVRWDRITLCAGLGIMMLWNASRVFGGINAYTHAIGLEVIFYLSLITAAMLTPMIVGVDEFKAKFREALATWRIRG